MMHVPSQHFFSGLQNENDRTMMSGYRKVAILEDFFDILQQVHGKDCLHTKWKKTDARVSFQFIFGMHHFQELLPLQVQRLYAYLPQSVIEQYVKLCAVCSLHKPHTTQPPLRPIVANDLFSCVQVSVRTVYSLSCGVY